mmetsp:Transcript_10149/g.35703  ORF Transcript_10149/g.35703 Transcript_10149/m.35703 type:complete len:210 (+) Transcript_10149:1505-2134(+)
MRRGRSWASPGSRGAARTAAHARAPARRPCKCPTSAGGAPPRRPWVSTRAHACSRRRPRGRPVVAFRNLRAQRSLASIRRVVRAIATRTTVIPPRKKVATTAPFLWRLETKASTMLQAAIVAQETRKQKRSHGFSTSTTPKARVMAASSATSNHCCPLPQRAAGPAPHAAQNRRGCPRQSFAPSTKCSRATASQGNGALSISSNSALGE